MRDGRRYLTRIVAATQRERIILTAMVPFGPSECAGVYHAPTYASPPPDSLSPIEQQLEAYAEEQNGW